MGQSLCKVFMVLSIWESMIPHGRGQHLADHTAGLLPLDVKLVPIFSWVTMAYKTMYIKCQVRARTWHTAD